MVELREEIDWLEFDLETEAGEEEREALEQPQAECVWCGAMLTGTCCELADWSVTLRVDEYRGPLRFDESDPYQWRVGVFVGGAWRWLDLLRTGVPEEPFVMSEPACPTMGCGEKFMRALRGEATEGRSR